MFEKVYEIINKIESNKKIIEEHRCELEKVRKRVVENSIELMNHLADESERVKILKIENNILYDNARIELFKEFTPNALKVWNEYVNKPYGAKTRERIKEKVMNETDCLFYAEEYEFHFSPDFKKHPKIYYFFRCQDLNIITNHGYRFLVGNKIQHVDFESLKLYYCNEYVENTYEEALNIYKEINNLKKEFDSVEKRVYELNKRLPSKYESINLGYPRWWDIA